MHIFDNIYSRIKKIAVIFRCREHFSAYFC
jgi:hypothetical protein